MRLYRVLDTKTSNPNDIGECLRGMAFQQEVGCYSCFDLVDGFQYVPYTLANDRIVAYFMDCDPEFHQEIKDRAVFAQYTNPHHYLDGTWVGWCWDGDGDLAFLLPDNTLVCNTDCKKDYTWEVV